jgi:hypothetical protein
LWFVINHRVLLSPIFAVSSRHATFFGQMSTERRAASASDVPDTQALQHEFAGHFATFGLVWERLSNHGL